MNGTFRDHLSESWKRCVMISADVGLVIRMPWTLPPRWIEMFGTDVGLVSRMFQVYFDKSWKHSVTFSTDAGLVIRTSRIPWISRGSCLWFLH